MPAHQCLCSRVSLASSRLTHARRCCQAAKVPVPDFDQGRMISARSSLGHWLQGSHGRTASESFFFFVESGRISNPPRKKTICAPFPGKPPHLAGPKPPGSQGRGSAQPPWRSNPHVGAKGPHTHSAGWQAGRPEGRWQVARLSPILARRHGSPRRRGRSVNLRRGFFCL